MPPSSAAGATRPVLIAGSIHFLGFPGRFLRLHPPNARVNALAPRKLRLQSPPPFVRSVRLHWETGRSRPHARAQAPVGSANGQSGTPDHLDETLIGLRLEDLLSQEHFRGAHISATSLHRTFLGGLKTEFHNLVHNLSPNIEL